MEQQQMDSIILRTWFLKIQKNGWSSESVDATERYDKIQERACKKSNCCSIEAKIFLVDTPFTFGHSQLIINFLDDIHTTESFQFEIAAPIIQKTLFVFKEVLSLKTLKEFKNLSKFTNTRNKDNYYIKTLILRVSAQEASGKEYKVHLVPYLKSTTDDCKKWYDNKHGCNHKAPGGLVGWLGERETDVERWKNNNKEIIDNIIINDWKLPELARLF